MWSLIKYREIEPGVTQIPICSPPTWRPALASVLLDMFLIVGFILRTTLNLICSLNWFRNVFMKNHKGLHFYRFEPLSQSNNKFNLYGIGL